MPIDAPSIDDAELIQRAQVPRHGFSDARGQPRRLRIAGHVHEIHDRDRIRFADGDDVRGLDAGRRRRLDRLDRRDEPVAAARDRLDEPRRTGIVAERLAQLRHGLRQGVFCDVGLGPQRVEQLLLGDERSGVVEQVKEQIQQLWREVNRLGAA